MANRRPVPSVMDILPKVELTNLLFTSNFFELFGKYFCTCKVQEPWSKISHFACTKDSSTKFI